MIDIYKASAGSGKTYTLSKTYLRLLLDSKFDDAYRNILAVTFTNKATEEMKERILEDLNEEGNKSAKARELLIHILHDYSAFSISTIDTFFQQTLRAFTRELGHTSGYQIELNKDTLLKETVDRIFDDMTESDKDLLKWFTDNVDETLQNGDKPNPEKDLSNLSIQIEEGGFIDNGDSSQLLDKQELKALSSRCKEIIRQYHKDVKESAIAIRFDDKTADNQLSRFQKDRKDYEFIIGDEIKHISTLLNALSKESPDLPAAKNLFYCLNPDSPRRKEYNTAVLLLDTTFSLGIVNEFLAKFRLIESEKNILCLSQTTKLLSDIIDGSDTPFVYEKTGVRYHHFLLDEFQDTSFTQWDNFKPLLANSVSEGYDNIIVGDVKQSIYRWRDSEWSLLNSEIENCFGDKTKVTPMQDNWRSNGAIVKFNNDFFEFASTALNLSKLYSDVRQNVKINDGQSGYITVDYCDSKAPTGSTQTDYILKYVKDALSRGAKPSDIGILLRYKNKGEDIAQALLGAGYSVVSDDSLTLNSSLVIRQLISLLYAIDAPDNTLENYIAKSTGITVEQIDYHSLVDLSDRLLSLIKDKTDDKEFAGQTAFIQSFMDVLLDWTQLYGNDLHLFLEYWDKHKDKLLVSSPEDPNAIRIMTVHKSKGLAFPVVIFPYSDEVELFKSSTGRRKITEWFSLDNGSAQRFGIKGEEKLFPVELSATKLENTFFSEALDKERDMQKVDNINLYYVCLTRARHELHIISKTPAQTFTGKGGKKKDSSPANKMSDILYRFCENRSDSDMESTIVFGEPYKFGNVTQKDKDKTIEFKSAYNIHQRNPCPDDPRIKASSQSWDFFSEEGIGRSQRRNGIRLHEILSRIGSTAELDAVLQGEAKEDREFLQERVLSHKEWFDPNLKVLNETSIICTDGKVCRPDRVTINGCKEVTVIDFKFGEHNDHHVTQVRNYMRFFTQMGYPQVRGYIWYVRDDKTLEVSGDLL